MEQKYCPLCGKALQNRFHETENKEVPYCEHCKDYRFPPFSCAVSMLVMDEDNNVLLIRQYGRDWWIFCAGYVDKGETAEHAVYRELQEELGLTPTEICFNASRYFDGSDTLMLNFFARVPACTPTPNWEVDEWRWFSLSEAQKALRSTGTAPVFFQEWMRKTGRTAQG